MTAKTPIVLISAGLLAPKKSDNPLARQHLYLNYSLVGLATIIKAAGYPALVLHGRFQPPDQFVAELLSRNLLQPEGTLFLSLPSSFAIPWAREVCAQIKSVSPAVWIVVGGRWVVAEDGPWIRRQIPAVDLGVFGTAERRIVDLLERENVGRVPHTDLTPGPEEASLPELPSHDFGLMDHFEDFQPAVEISRGCGMRCAFCAEAFVGMSKMKAPNLVAAELRRCAELYESTDIRPYFQASYFHPTQQWSSALVSATAGDGRISWRTETRVDGLAPGLLAPLAKAGLSVVDLGLESASPKQLVAMNKTRDPKAYLGRASALLKGCADNGILAKVNVLFYAGESKDTVAETTDWLEKHRAWIKGLSVGPAIVYRYGAESRTFLNALARLGAVPISETALDDDGFVHLHLSSEMTHDAAQELSLRLSRSFMSARDYFDLKSFSYFPRGFSFEDFVSLAGSARPELLPFSWP